ncbi:MAG: PKD domain-containing protein [Bacteroidota bacterium]
MISRRIIILSFSLLFSICVTGLANSPLINKNEARISSLHFIENKNQWNPCVLYKVDLPIGNLFLEKSAFTYIVYNKAELDCCHKPEASAAEEVDHMINCHAFRVNFMGSNEAVKPFGGRKFSEYYNYFIGNDQSHWASGVSLFHSVTYPSLYQGIDLNVGNDGLNLKYEFLVNAGADPFLIRLEYEGTDGIALSEGNLVIKTSVDNIIEQRPYAYQLFNNDTIEIPCYYKIKENKVVFAFPDGYRKDLPLVIDPVVVGATYAGSVSNSTYGHSATYDAAGNIYAAGNCFGTGWPASTGSFQTSYHGSNDCGIIKLNPTATTEIWATFLGGSSADYAHSLIVNDNNELFIYGSTSSTNFPVTAGCYQSLYGGGAADIFVTHFNTDATAIVGSTYLGGSGSDGRNSMYINYGDTYRGEMVLDSAQNPYVVSFSNSSNFPTSIGAYDNTYNGLQDGVVCKLNSTLTNLESSTYIGGTGNEAIYGIAVNDVNQVCLTGGTNSTDFPTTVSTYQTNYQGGTYDGFICILNNDLSMLLSSTYFGTALFDASFFIQTNSSNEVYIFGQSDSTISITPGCYGNANSPQFIAKLDYSLSQVIFTTTIGSGTLSAKLSPSAFFLDDCGHIYGAGWGNTANCPVSPNAVQATTDGSDFYIFALEPNASALAYATFYGSPSNWEHVDGGTSRFDKNGKIYQAVCEGSGTAFPTTPNAWRDFNAVSWDLAVFVIDFQLCSLNASIGTAASTEGCAPFQVDFTNESTLAVGYNWDFGDGTPVSHTKIPSHTYTSPGTYQVSCIAIDSTSSIVSDTAFLTIKVYLMPEPAGFISQPGDVCAGTSSKTYTTLPLSQATSYEWTIPPGTSGSSDSNSIILNFSPNSSSGMLSVKGVNVCGSGSSSHMNLNIVPPPVVNAEPVQSIDSGYIATFIATVTSDNPPFIYTWSNGSNTQSINVSPPQSSWYIVTVTDANSCTAVDSVFLSINNDITLKTSVPVFNSCAGNFTVPINVDHFNFVDSLFLTLIYDHTILSYVNFTNPNQALSQGTLNITSLGNKVLISWHSLTPVTVASGKLVELVFSGASGSSNFNWDLSSSGACYYSHAGQTNISKVFINGSITFGNCGGIEGTVTYINGMSSPISGIFVKAIQGNTTILQDTTTTNGNFILPALPNGNYIVKPQTEKISGGYNSVDALFIMKYFTGLFPLSGMKLQAADVDNSGYVNTTDALLIARRFVKIINSFPAGDWLFNSDTLTVLNNNQLIGLKGVCYGDVNGSFQPQAKEESTAILRCEGSLKTGTENTIEIPIFMKQTISVSSISMVIHFNSLYIDITNILIKNPGTCVYNILDDQVRIAWYSIVPWTLKSNDTLLILAAHTVQQLTILKNYLELEPATLFTDSEGNSLRNLQITYPEILISKDKSWLGQNVPNPFTGITAFPFYIPEESTVSLRIFTITGECIFYKTAKVSPGYHAEEITATSLSPGVYYYELESNGSTAFFKGTRKMVVVQ